MEKQENSHEKCEGSAGTGKKFVFIVYSSAKWLGPIDRQKIM